MHLNMLTQQMIENKRNGKIQANIFICLEMLLSLSDENKTRHYKSKIHVNRLNPFSIIVKLSDVEHNTEKRIK